MIVEKTVEHGAGVSPEKNSGTDSPYFYDYESVPGDPIGVKMYTLKNGLKLYLSINDAEPRIYTNIPVRAGSKHDPSETTGLAHYLEHMMFKGTSSIGALDWEKEKILLQKISDLYEQHRFETVPERRREIYRQIDAVSNEAARLVAANEYDKLVSTLGAKGTNAYTWVEQTVYVNDIPSNELERWMKLESERFREVTLRLFHTELETVYEEFNMNQDRDYRKVSKAVNERLFPTHPYGTRTTMGEGEHLKNPSHVKIHEYFSTYYRPNNMAIVLAGDFNPDDAVRLAEQYFGDYEPAGIPGFSFEKQPPLEEVTRLEIFGQESPYVQLAWRFDGANSEAADYLTMIYRLLYNGRAGLIDLNLLQKQRVLDGRAFATTMEDFSVFQLYGKPREGQRLEEVEALLLGELEKIKRGEFEDWLLEACVKDLKLNEIRANEKNNARAAQMTNAFILGLSWQDYVHRLERLSTLTKADIVRFAGEHFKENFVVAYKRHGDDPSVLKVEKPPITPVTVNRSDVSDFTKNFLIKEAPALEPVFVDYEKEISSQKLRNGVAFDYIKNKDNPTFILDYIFEMGKNSDKEMALALSYLPYLGTHRYSPDQLKQEFFRLGMSFNVSVNYEQLYVTLAGLDESFEEGLQLFEHLLANVKSDETALTNLVDDVLQRRENDKKSKEVILRKAMYNYACYGPASPFTNRLTGPELRARRPENLIEKIKSLTGYEHRVFYYGSKSPDDVARLLEKYRQSTHGQLPVISAIHFPELPTTENRVIFVDFPMVQSEIMFVSKGTEYFNLEEYLMSDLYNTYFGAGLSSIVFQEIRESRALAYSASAFHLSPSWEDRSHYLRSYVGTQADKMPEAMQAMQEIIENMPVSAAQIGHAAQSIQKKIESGRVTKDSIYWSYRANRKRGFSHDLRRDIYEKMKVATPDDLLDFHSRYIRGRNYTFLVLGSRNSVDMGFLRSIGQVTELSLNEVFRFV